MSIRTRVSHFVNRLTKPNRDLYRPLAVIPSRRANIVITHEKALELASCFACVRVISEDMAKLPWNVFAKEGEKRRRLDGSTLSRLLNTRPNPEMGAFSFRETIMSHVLTWGNGYAEIERDMAGRPVALWLLTPDRVDPKRYDDGNIYYEVTNGYGDTIPLTQRDVFHIHGIGFDGIQGYSMVGLAAQTLGFGLAAEEYGSGFFGNQTTAGLSFKTDAKLSDEGFNRLKADVDARKGSKHAFEGLILEQGLDFANPNMSQVDAQFTETNVQVAQTVCRWWRVPPHKIAELSRAHFNNIESENINYATDTLMPWAKRLEEEADYKLIGARSQASYTRIAIQGLMRGDSAARASFYKEMFNMGVYSQNKILELEDMDPIGPEGDEHYIQVNMTTLKKLIAEPIKNDAAAMDNNADPKQVIKPAVENLASRCLAYDLQRADTARHRYDTREAFAQWIDGHHRKSKGRQKKALADLLPSIENAYQKHFDPQVILRAYDAASRVQLFNFYDGNPVSHEAVQSVFLEELAK